MADSALLTVLDDLERRSRLAVVRFTDGEAYDLRIISTMHAEEGGDVVAEVARNLRTSATDAIPEGAFMNFYLADVESITIDGVCVFGHGGAGGRDNLLSRSRSDKRFEPRSGHNLRAAFLSGLLWLRHRDNKGVPATPH